MGCIIESNNEVMPQNLVPIVEMQISKKQKGDKKTVKYEQIKEQANIQNVFKIQADVTCSDKFILNKALSNHFLLYRLAPPERNQIVNCFDTYECPANTIIFKKQQKPALLFFIKEGKVQVKRNCRTDGLPPIILQRGSFFGDLALIYNSSRSATIESLSYCQFLCLESTLLKKIIKQTIKRNYEISKKFIQNIAIFTYLNKKQKKIVASNTLLLKFEKNKVIFYEGDDANSIYIVVSGKVEIKIPGKPPLLMGSGDSFGQNCFQGNSVRSGSATAIQQSSLLSIGRDSLRQCLGKHLREISLINILKWSFSRNQLLARIPTLERDKLIALVDTKQYKNKETICEQGGIAESIIINLQQKINGDDIGTIYNLKYLTSQTQNDLRIDKKLIKNGKGFVGILTFQNLKKVLGDTLNSFAKNISWLDLKLRRIQSIKCLELSDLFVLSKIGSGRISQIYLVNEKYKRKYALKVVQKSSLTEYNYKQSLKFEQKVMSLQIPYSVKLHKKFEDDNNLYLITNYIDGFRFCQIIKKVGPFSRQKAKIMISSLLIAVQQLHHHNIVHRDLQPQNIIIDQHGQLNIVDFSVSKQLKYQTNFRTFTLVGTPHYMAPEIVNNKGYSFAVDFWSIGIIMYEILFGCLPFKNESSDDPYQILRQIDSNDLQFPNNLIQKPVKQMIQKLLCKNTTKRVQGGFSQLKKNIFFHNINWDNISEPSNKINLKMKINGVGEEINEPLAKFMKKNNLFNNNQLQTKQDK